MLIKDTIDFIKDAFKSIKRNNSMNITVILTIIITFLILGIFILINLNLNLNLKNISNNIELTVYLKDNINLIEKNEIELNLKEDQYVKSIEYKSKDTSFIELQDSFKDNKELLEGYNINNNPLLDSFIIKIKKPEYEKELSKKLLEIKGIDSISNQSGIIDIILKCFKFTKIISIALEVIFVSITIFLIANTIKISIYNKRNEIFIMKTLGATEWFIKFPFLIEGAIIVNLGAIASASILTIIYYKIYKWLINTDVILDLIGPIESFKITIIVFIMIGSTIGILGSNKAAKKFI